jgi:hypothetical protein
MLPLSDIKNFFTTKNILKTWKLSEQQHSRERRRGVGFFGKAVKIS